ncbi:MAG: KOW domain-containing RNA-binding protein [Synergistaceae bacterium]|jgi:ribosomal protein L14E/L6E/L27E|nr:KOW domain-containing RNA-binding protein [Synergistaceae bacterium]
MDKPLNDYQVGRVVISKRGKDVGRLYVIVGVLDGGRLALADAKGFNVRRPKSKNPKHVQWTSRVVTEVAASVEAGKNIDHGDFCRFLVSVKKNQNLERAPKAEGVLDESLTR